MPASDRRATAVAAEPPGPGEVVDGRYLLCDALDRGGMGTVFRAEDQRLGRSCAVKFMHPALAVQPGPRSRFEREARAAGQLRLENVVAVTDCGTHAGLPFIVMELLEGQNLQQLLRRERQLPAPRAVELVVQACRGVHAVHGHGIVHRDLKPSNLFVTRHADGRDLVKVLDFGVAKSVGEESGATQAGAVVGTIQYMPPEQVRGEAVDVRTDVYALGAVLYETLAGRPPYIAAESHVLIHNILYEPLAPLRGFRAGLPDALYALIERALARDPRARPETAEALAAALGRVLRIRVDAVNTSAPVVTTADLPAHPEVREQSAPASSAPPRAARRTPWLAGAIALLLIAAAAATLWLRANRPAIEGAPAPVAAPTPRAEPAREPEVPAPADVPAATAPVKAATAPVEAATPPVKDEPTGDAARAPAATSGRAHRSAHEPHRPPRPARSARAPRDGLDLGEVFAE